MRALSLDYRRNNTKTQHWVGLAVLALAIASAVAMGMYYRKISVQDTRLEVLAAKIEHKLHPGHAVKMPSAVEAQQTSSEIKAANEVMQQLNLPWDKLFVALEGANSDDVALLGLEPDAKKQLVRVSGEARNFEALFAYVRQLQTSKAMSAIYLKHHQIQEQDPEKPIRFTLDASWSGKH